MFRGVKLYLRTVGVRGLLSATRAKRMKPGCNRTFYCGSNGFDNEWLQGENIYLSRGSSMTRRCT